ncbi:MAG: right-handed parallel beta-helix repeat-containing protein, partial [Eubacterium sp.]|nr:right-handed parallel beta-helix repeat-containing protein [Eubacterium sp.]
MFKRFRRIISAFTAAFILFSSTVCIPVDMSAQDTVSKAAIAAPEEETGEIFAPEEGADEGAAGEDILAPEGADEGGVGEDTAGEEGYTDGSTGDVKADELTAPEAGDEGSAGEDDAEDAEVSDDTEETEEDTEEKTRTGVDIVTPDDIKPGDLIKKNTFINMYGYDSYTLVIDDSVVEEYGRPGEGLGEESDGDYGELDGESDEEYTGFTLSDNVLVVEPVEREPDTIYLETIYRGRHVLTENVFKTLLSMGEDIILGGDTVLTEPLVIEDGATHTIDLNGNDIFLDEESNAKGSVITLKAGSKLILKDSGSGDPGEIRGGDSDHGAGISVEDSSSLEMTGGAITKNEANQGAGLYIADGASASLDGVTVSLNNVKSADDLHRGKLGGGIYVAPGAQCTLSGCTIESNYANNGGGIYSLGTIQLTDVTVVSNTAANDAGGIYTEGGAVI